MFKTLYPPSVQWEITPLCNQNCIHCYNHYRTDFDSIANTFLSSEDYFLSIAKKLIENKPLSVTITGGEPLLVWNKIKSSIKLFRENDILVNLNTNAILVNQEIAEFLYSYRISCFVSLPTSDPILCDFITSSHQSLEKISKGVKILREFKVSVSCNMVVSKLNVKQIYSTAQYCKDVLNVNSFFVTKPTKPLNEKTTFDEHLLSYDDLQELFANMVKITKELKIKVDSACTYPLCAYEDDEIFQLLALMASVHQNTQILL